MKTFISFELYVRDVQATCQFFNIVFAAETGWAEEDFAVVWFGRTRVILNQLKLEEFTPPNPILKDGALQHLGSGVEVVISVENLGIVRQRAIDAGAAKMTDVVERPWGQRDFRFLLPDGHYIRVTEADERVQAAW